jgi:hypothetical protein
LKQAMAALPHVQRLAVQRAFLLEHSGHASEAQRVVDGVEDEVSEGPTPRAHYNDFPTDAFVGMRQSLHDIADARRAMLALVLNASPEAVQP